MTPERPDPAPPLRIANFMDSPLAALEGKGNLASAPELYNPRGVAEQVVHFTPSPGDTRFGPLFAPHRIEVFPYLEPRGEGPKLLRALRAFLRVRRKIRDERLNVIRGRLPYFGSLLGCLSGRLLGVPSLVSLGGDNRLAQETSGEYQFGNRRLSYVVEWLVLRLADAILAPNHYTKRYVAGLIGERRAEEKVAVIPWRIDPTPVDEGPITDPLAADAGRPLVVVVGFLNRYKHTDVMLDVAERVVSGGRALFAFCGDGPLREEGERRFAGSADVRFLGWQPRSAVQALIRRAAVVLVPMSGYVLLEAAAEGRPVVVSDLEWHGELVEDGVTGFLVEARNVDRWVERVGALLDDRDRAAALGSRLEARFDADYAPERVVEREIDLYRSLVARRRA